VTASGRGVAVVPMPVGIGRIGVLTTTVAGLFVGEEAGEDKVELSDRLDRAAFGGRTGGVTEFVVVFTVPSQAVRRPRG